MLDSLLDQLARQRGIGDAYHNYRGELLHISRDTKTAILAAMGCSTSDAAAIMNIINKRESQRIIKAVTKRDKDIARRIEDEMFVFADLIRLDAKDLGTLVRGLESKLLVPALKGAEDKLRDKMFGCMSSRAAQSIADEIADRGPMPMSEVLEAQRAVIQVAKRMADAGDIVIGGGGDEYV